MFSYVNDLVFDPFAGNGTILLGAQNLEREAIGIELNKTYCELAQNRILQETGTIIFNDK
jgi:site-specific DNA-methyltransferase (adenine-specific)